MNQSHGESTRRFTLAVLLLGLVIVLLLPMGYSVHWKLSCTLADAIADMLHPGAEQHSHVLVWEIAAILWSLTYSLLYHVWAFPEAYGDGISSKAVARLSTLLTLGTVAVGVAVCLVFRIDEPNGLTHIGAQLLILVWLVGMDILMASLLPIRWVSAEIRQDYRKFLQLVDGPAFVSLTVIFAFVAASTRFPSPTPPQEELSAFGAGAAAMSLLVVNVAFTVLFLRRQS